MPTIAIRPAGSDDAAAIAAIYNPYVATTTITFEEAPVTGADIAARIRDVADAGLPWLVASVDGSVAAYAYATRWRARPAYRYAVESTVYVDERAQGRGLGGRVYRALLEELRARGLHTVIGGIAQPNERSVGLHERLGFRKVAHFEEVGFKLGRRIDVAYWQLRLGGEGA
ncbi:arsinothricin resistance N-acetyltransferase ArsN1 family B [uncultured Massilia sp.]|uniref:arsinothricin resistance N-acetyltransferase ArsN1 family B n=1 Tax=uncultured Massilia sp. TaxID=169973 RepID=UPI0025D7FFC5|nr:arsinothricin resistance N-acetyltransferase ArsN1 family B [uncultured Massilia sp.]